MDTVFYWRLALPCAFESAAALTSAAVFVLQGALAKDPISRSCNVSAMAWRPGTNQLATAWDDGTHALRLTGAGPTCWACQASLIRVKFRVAVFSHPSYKQAYCWLHARLPVDDINFIMPLAPALSCLIIKYFLAINVLLIFIDWTQA